MTGPISQGVGGAADYRFDSQGGQNAESGDTYSTTGGANPNINIFGPPEDMKTLVYSPQVRVLIAHRGRQYDVSKDLIRGTVIRKENSASSLFFTLANNGDYTGLFDRMDRVTVFMKRIRFQQVFSGYLDTVPYKQLYGGHAEFKATCTLKRLMHTWWNPRLTEAASIFDQYITGALGDGQGGRDSGLGNMLRNILHNVGKWDQDKIHIQNFPLQFYTFLQEQLFVSRSGNQQQADKFKHLLLGTDYNTMAPGNYAGFTNAAGPAGAQSLGEPFYLQEIVAACDMKGLGPNQVDMTNSQQLAEASAIGANSSDLDGAQQEAFTQIQQSATNWNVSTHQNDAAILGVACAMVETGGGATIFNFVNAAVPESLKYVPNDGVRSDGTSVGIMQQTEGNGWGNVAQRMNPRQAASMFFDRLRSLDWRNMDPGVAIQQVQQSAYPARYAPAIQLATQKVQAFRSAQTAGSAAIASNPITAGISTAASAGAGLDLQEAVTSYSSTPLSPEGVSIATNKPYPDSEHAVIEAAAQIGKPYVYGGKGPQSYDCITEGSLVATSRGEVPIEDVTDSDFVMTRRGYRRVLRSWKVRDDAEVVSVEVDGRILSGTPDHRVWTENRGWVPLSGLERFDSVVLCRTRKSNGYALSVKSLSGEDPTENTAARDAATSLQVRRSGDETSEAKPTRSSSMGLRITDTPTRPDLATERIFSAPASLSMWRCGSTITDPYPPGTKSITSTTTLSTTTFPTWIVSKYQSIVEKVRPLDGYMTTLALSAVKNFKRFAPRSVTRDSAASSTNRSSITTPDKQRKSVYDLSVEGEHEFFANGVLVHNCSGLVSWAFRAAGVYVPPQTLAIRDSVPRVATNIPQRGDLVICYNAGHVVLALGPTTCIEAPHPGAFVQVSAMPPIESVHRPAEWGGLGPTSPHLNPLTSGPGAPAGTGTWASSGTGSSGGNEQIARNLFAYHFTPERFASDIAEMFSENHKEYIDAEPLIQTAQAVSRASLRNFASAPNGDFMAYYPDYFGLNGTQAVVQLEDIELKDVKINFSDDNLTTHVYVAGERDTQTGEEINVYDWLASAGSVTVEHEWLFARLRQISPGDLQDASGRELMKRFGVRPFKMPFPMAATEALEFLLACQIFMEKWAMQYQTTASFTFLPELFPGMRVILNGHNLQVYVSEVVHTFDFEQGFQTQAVISAPSVPGAAGRMSFDGFGGGGIPTTDTNILSGLGFGYSFSNSSVVPGL